MKKNLSLIINLVLLIAVGVLFILVIGNKKACNSANTSLANDSTKQNITLPIAYLNVDSLLLNYEFAKVSNEALIKKQENSRLTLNTKAKQLQREMEDFQRKLQAQAFLSRERAEKAQANIVKKQQKLQRTEARLTQQLMQEQQKMSEQLRDTINNFLKIYNKDKKFEVIISNTANDNILLANKKYDITKEVIKALNKRYKK